MQLVNLDFLNIFATALVVPLVLAVVATAVVGAVRPTGANLGLVFLAVFAFGVLGFVTGKVMSNSRDSAVGAVVPAVLTLFGGVSVYIIGVKGARVQGPVAAMMLTFALSLFVGSHFGAQLRYSYEVFINDPRIRAQHDDLAEDLRLNIELRRLLNYVTVEKLKKDFEAKYGVSLTGFEHGTAPDAKPQVSNKK